jgi:hypothetical protein
MQWAETQRATHFWGGLLAAELASQSDKLQIYMVTQQGSFVWVGCWTVFQKVSFSKALEILNIVGGESGE